MCFFTYQNCCHCCCPACGRPYNNNWYYNYPTITWIEGDNHPVTYTWDNTTGGYIKNDKGSE